MEVALLILTIRKKAEEIEKQLLFLVQCQHRTPKSVGNFYKSFLSPADDKLESKTPNALLNDSFAVVFIHLELRRDPKEDYRNVGESKAGKFL